MNYSILFIRLKFKNQCLFLNSCNKIKQEMLAAKKGWKDMKNTSNKDSSISSIFSMPLKSLFHSLAFHLINASKLNIINVLWQLIPHHFVFPPLTLPKFLPSFLMFKHARKYISVQQNRQGFMQTLLQLSHLQLRNYTVLPTPSVFLLASLVTVNSCHILCKTAFTWMEQWSFKHR